MRNTKNRNWLAILLLLPGLAMSQADSAKKITRHEFTVQQVVDYAMKNNVKN